MGSAIVASTTINAETAELAETIVFLCGFRVFCVVRRRHS